MWEACRFCGSTDGRELVLVAGERACPRCAASPLCDRCGHPRESHSGVFVAAGRTGAHVWLDLPSLTKVDCDCKGFAPVTGAFRDAAFAEPDENSFRLRTTSDRRSS